TDAVKDLKLYKGGFPAQYGGRLSSVIDVKLKEGNNKKFSGQGGIGLISSRLTLEGPIRKEKSSFIVSGRRTYFDLITRGINSANESNEDYNPIPDYYFYDLNTKVNFELSEKDHLYLSGYFGRDFFGFENDNFDFGFDWGNATGTARWNHTFNPRLFSNTTLTFSDYRYEISNRLTGFSFNLDSKIKDLNFKTDFYQNLNRKNTLRYGGNITYHLFTVGRLKAGSDDGEISFSAGQDFDGMEYGAYISDDYDITPRLTLNGGLRLSGFSNDGEFYYGVEPRFASNFKLNEKLSFKASYARMYQYLHLVSNSGISLPTDVWYPSTKLVKPQKSDQVAIGGSWLFDLLGQDFFLTNEYFYKWLDNQVDFIDGAELFANDNLEQEFVFGDGYAYGSELSVEKREGKLTGWIGYTYSIIKRGNFEGPKGTVMNGRYYSPRYDRRHDISVVAMYEINRRLTASATWVYGSGDLTWLPRGRYSFQDVYGGNAQTFVPVYGDRNDVRLPDFHRLDLNFIIKFFPKWGESDLTISVVNAYDRRNAFFIYIEPQYADDNNNNSGNEFDIPERLAAKQVSLFPILPALTWNFKF
ncbi:MAG TPA: TonB-dependent receptor, partial [Saprospiraceae bacterium]|nr:TonB-dependent receptor [Saprospiraceae bacterium]